MKISICIPTFNQSQYLVKAINSAFTQTLPPFEVVVSNDCSTDNTVQALEEMTKQYPNLKVINQPVNLGIAKNTDQCLRAGTGDLIVRLDSDDYLDTQYCEKLSALLGQYPEAGFAHGNVTEINQYDEVIGERTLFRNEAFFSSEKALKAAAKGYRVAANIIMFRKEALVQVNYCTNRPNYVEDYHLTSDLTAHGWGNVFCNQFLSFYRVWVDTAKVRQRRKMMEIVGLYKVFHEVLEPAYQKLKLNPAVLAKTRELLARNQAECLGWDVYNDAEKDELTVAILQLSASPKVKLYIKLYRNGWGNLLKPYNRVKYSLRNSLKKLLR